MTHTQLIGALNGDPGTTTTITADGVGLQLGPIIEQVKATMVANGFALASHIPAVNRTIILVPGSEFSDLQSWYRVGLAVGGWLPWVSLGLIAADVLVANKRRAALVGAAVGLAIGAGVIVASLAIGRVLLPTLLPGVPTDAFEALYATATTALADLARVVLVLGVVVAALGWWFGPSRMATRLRGGWLRAASWIRGRRDQQGLSTGAFGRWLGSHRGWVGAAVGVVAAGVLLLNRPWSIGQLVWTAVVALLVVALAQLLEG